MTKVGIFYSEISKKSETLHCMTGPIERFDVGDLGS